MKIHLIIVAMMFILIAGFAFGRTSQAVASTLDKDISDAVSLGDDDEFYLLTPQDIYLHVVPGTSVPEQTIFFRRNRASWTATAKNSTSSGEHTSLLLTSHSPENQLPDYSTPSDFIAFISFSAEQIFVSKEETVSLIEIKSDNKSLIVYVHYQIVGENYDTSTIEPLTKHLTFYFNNGVKPNSQTLQISAMGGNSVSWTATPNDGNIILSPASGQTNPDTPLVSSSTTEVSIDTRFFQSLGTYTSSFSLAYSNGSITDTVEVKIIVSKDKLSAGERLTLGQSLLSQNGQYKLAMQVDGNLVLYRTTDNFVMWASNTYGQGANQCLMQADGNLVIYNQGGQPLWASVTDGNAGAFLKLENDGRFIVYKSTANFTPIWSTSRLCSGRTLQSARYLRSGNGEYKLEMQTDGNLVLRNSSNQILWASNTYGNPGSRVEMQVDGNLVIRTPNNQIIWASNTYTTSTASNNGSTLRVQDDGGLVIYRPNGAAIWNRTQGRLY